MMWEMSRFGIGRFGTAAAGGLLIVAATLPALAATDIRDVLPGVADEDNLVFVMSGDYVTDETLLVPDGWTLDGNGHTITAVDPGGDHFRGAVVRNGGTVAHVMNLTVTASGLANVCDAGNDRLRGIMLESASGSIMHCTVVGINQGVSGCQEGNGIEVRNAPFDGTHPNTQYVTINHNYVDDYQKTGILVNGDVSAAVTNNYVGSADLPTAIAANSIQIGFGASASVNNNEILGNEWDVNDSWVATAVLLYAAGDVNVSHNVVSGDNTDVGIYAYLCGTVNIMNNGIGRTGSGGFIDAYGYGVYFYGNSGRSKIVRNTFSNWNVVQDGADLDRANIIDP